MIILALLSLLRAYAFGDSYTFYHILQILDVQIISELQTIL